MISPINYYLALMSKLEFSPPATPEKIQEFKNQRDGILKKALDYEREYYTNQVSDKSEGTI